MADRKLIIGNKRYSSWSLRPWLLMTHFGLSFEEILVPLDTPEFKPTVLKYSPSGKVPCLVEGDIHVHETLAIFEFLAENHPELPIWPRDRAARALARALASEMHAGFTGLRGACPMNLRTHFAFKDRGPAATADVARIEDAWRDARARFGAGGPFLFGEFSAADAMFAPVVTRLDTYSWPVAADTRAYMDAVLALPAFRTWKAGADAETAIVGADEVED
ncbi:glutathione S-transferase family protein [Pinisolibacter sp.]|uniref:glutathione S-transferase family protein n=1 Tax=Pinisolibacter sp. TaxID=2172024 RepID=UPI002FDE1B95